MPIRTCEESAVLLATMMNKAGMSRARVSDKTIRIISGRKRLEGSFRLSLNEDLVEYGYVLVRRQKGGQALVRISVLEAAKTLTTANVFSPDEIASLKKGKLNIDPLRDALIEPEEEDDGDD